MPKKLNNKAVGATGIFVTVAVIAAIGLAGWAVYRHNHKTTTSTASGTQAGQKTTASNTDKAATQAVDPYSGWKTYCDSVYDYCFKYPTTWSVASSNSAATVGGEGGIALLSPDKTVGVTYGNAFVKDNSLISFTTEAISKLSAANQDLSLVGGFSSAVGAVGNYLASYHVIDSSILTTYPLEVGTTSQFPSNPAFTDQNTGNLSYQGSLTAEVGFNTQAQVQAWFSSTDAKASAQILESLYYDK